MKKNCTVVHFSLRKSKQNKKGESPIEISISANKERVYFSSGKYANVNDWNRTKQLVKSKAKDANLINGFLIQARNKIYELEIELIKLDNYQKSGVRRCVLTPLSYFCA